jgi:hypothetical protein
MISASGVLIFGFAVDVRRVVASKHHRVSEDMCLEGGIYSGESFTAAL